MSSRYDHWLTTAPDDDNAIAERADELLAAYRTDPDKIAEADESWAGTLDGSAYADMERALADLHTVEPGNLFEGAWALPRLYRLARDCYDARDKVLQEMAESDARAEAAQAQRDSDDFVTEREVDRYEERML